DLGAETTNHRTDAEMVRGHNLSHTGRLARAHEFVARREDRHLGPAIGDDLAVPHRRGKRQLARPETAASFEQAHAFAEVAAARANMIGSNILPLYEDLIAVALRVLLDNNAVGAVGHRRAREDADSLA